MRQFKNETYLGIIIVVSIIIFVTGVLFLSGYEFRGDNYTIIVNFTNATGLSKDDPVMIMGLTVGKVESLKLNKTVVEAKVNINRSVQLPEDSKLMIRTLNLMGEKYVAVTLGKSENFVRQDDVLSGTTELDMGDMAKMVHPLNDRITKFLDQMNELTNKETSDGIKKTLTDVSDFTVEVKKSLNTQLTQMNDLTKRLRLTVSRIDSVTIEEKGQIKDILQKFNMLGDSLNLAISKFSTLSNSASNILEKIDSGQGTIGTLINDKSLLTKIETLTVHIDSFFVDFMAHPKKYVKLSIF